MLRYYCKRLLVVLHVHTVVYCLTNHSTNISSDKNHSALCRFGSTVIAHTADLRTQYIHAVVYTYSINTCMHNSSLNAAEVVHTQSHTLFTTITSASISVAFTAATACAEHLKYSKAQISMICYMRSEIK
jgi:hypothetical protein